MSTTNNDDVLAGIKDLTSPHDAEGREFLGRSYRFLLNVTEPRIVGRMLPLGYDDAEHAEGLQLHAVASGQSRPLRDFASQWDLAVLQSGGAVAEAIKEVDAFENAWFPRVRAAIARHLDPKDAERLAGIFFKDMAQQPEGPQVLASVEKFVTRWADLKASQEKGAAQVVKSLEKAGLTAEAVAAISARIEKARKLAPVPAGAVPAEQQRAAAEAQLNAFQKLKGWYAYWAELARGSLPYLDLVRLGLRANKGGRKAADGGTGEGGTGVGGGEI